MSNKHPRHWEPAFSRRDFLTRSGGGFGALALSHLLAQETQAAAEGNSLFHHEAKAKSVIFVFLQGGPSHIDLFDPKPALRRLAGQAIPNSFKPVITAMGEFHSPILPSTRQFKRHGDSGMWVSDWLPHTAKIVDEMSLVRSCHMDGLNHVGSVCQMNTGSTLAGRPSLGAWASYGLGNQNENLPEFVVMLDRKAEVHGGARNWSAGFMPSTYAGTLLHSEGEPIKNLDPAKGTSRARQRHKLDFLKRMNERHAVGRKHESALESRIDAYELAFRMQSQAPEAVELGSEPQHVRDLYGLDEKPTSEMARSCLMARRLVERGVRFIQIYSGAGNRWDAHDNIEKNHSELCREVDKPVAGLIQDLKQRGMLEDTLVVWGGEFGRTPMSEKGDGRDHNPTGFSMFMAGGGVKRGLTYGSTDEVGLHAVENRVHVRDLHATILHQMGLKPMNLTYMHNGRQENPVMNTGEVVHDILAT